MVLQRREGRDFMRASADKHGRSVVELSARSQREHRSAIAARGAAPSFYPGERYHNRYVQDRLGRC